MRATALLPLLPIALLGCGPPPDESRLVLLDEAARLSGALVQLDHWEGAPAFAIRLNPDERPMLLTQTEARRLEVPAHSLAYVEGAGAQVRVLDLEGDLARDALTLTGSQGAAQRVAKLMDATMTALGDDRFQLQGTELLDRSAFLDAPRGLREVRPVETTPEAMRSLLGSGERGAAPALTWSEPGRAESVPMRMVGVYAGERTTLIIDAEGGFTLVRGCGDAEQGTIVQDDDRLVLMAEDSSPLAVHPLDAGGLRIGDEQLEPVQLEPVQEVKP